jgi:hypothetical protein
MVKYISPQSQGAVVGSNCSRSGNPFGSWATDRLIWGTALRSMSVSITTKELSDVKALSLERVQDNGKF